MLAPGDTGTREGADSAALHVDVRATNSAAQRSLYKAREPIYPKAVNGVFRRLKWGTMAMLLAVYYLIPFIRWDRGPGKPDQAVLVDLDRPRLYFFWLELWPQEIYFIAGLLILAATAINDVYAIQPLSEGFDKTHAERLLTIAYGIAATFILAGALLLPSSTGTLGRTLRALGDGSYSIYLFHLFAIQIVSRMLAKLPLIPPSMGFLLLMAAGTAVGWAAWLHIERPSLTRSRSQQRPA